MVGAASFTFHGALFSQTHPEHTCFWWETGTHQRPPDGNYAALVYSRGEAEHVAEVAAAAVWVAVAEVLGAIDDGVGCSDLRGGEDGGDDDVAREIEQEERVVIHGRLPPPLLLLLLLLPLCLATSKWQTPFATSVARQLQGSQLKI